MIDPEDYQSQYNLSDEDRLCALNELKRVRGFQIEAISKMSDLSFIIDRNTTGDEVKHKLISHLDEYANEILSSTERFFPEKKGIKSFDFLINRYKDCK